MVPPVPFVLRNDQDTVPWRLGIGGVTEPRPYGWTVLAENLVPEAAEDSSAATALV